MGVDGVIVICEKGPLNGREFRVQVKASNEFRLRNSAIVLPGIKRSTLEYWFLSPLPTMIVAFDATSNAGYYRWHNELFPLLNADASTLGSVVAVTIPQKNVLVPESWGQIREDLGWHYTNLALSLQSARNARSVLPTIHALAAAVRQLNSIDHQPIPVERRTPQQEGILALLEIIQHRDIIGALTKLLRELDVSSEGAARLQQWVTAYHSAVTSVFPAFDSVPSGDRFPPDYEISYARNLIHAVRPKLIESASEMIMQMTPCGNEDA